MNFKFGLKKNIRSIGCRSTHHKEGRMDHLLFLSYLFLKFGVYKYNPVLLSQRSDKKWMEELSNLLLNTGRSMSDSMLELMVCFQIKKNSNSKQTIDSDVEEIVRKEKVNKQDRLKINITKRFIKFKNQNNSYVSSDHPRFNQLTLLGKEIEISSRDLLFLKAIFQVRAWKSRVTRDSIQSLLLFDKEKWLRNELTTYLTNWQSSYDQYREHQVEKIMRNKELDDEALRHFTKLLDGQKESFKLGCQELLELLRNTEKSMTAGTSFSVRRAVKFL